MIELLKFVLSDFWTFLGFLIILNGISGFIFLIWNRFWRHWNIRKWGYPPSHCDADGDFKTDES